MSQIGTFIGFIVMARASALWMLYMARALDGSTAGNLSLAQAYISDHTAPHERAKSFGLIGIAFGVGFFIGPSLTGYLSTTYALTTPIYLAACMSFTSIMCTTFLLKGGRQSHHAFDDREKALHWSTYTRYFSRPGLRERLLQFLFFITAFSLFVSGFALFAERRFTTADGRPYGPREIGYLFGYVGLLGIILQGGLIGRLVKRFGEAALVVSGFVTLVLGYFGLGLAASGTFLLFAGTLAAGRQEQGVVLGITQSLMSMASIVAPVVGGILIQHQMLRAWAWCAAALAAVGVFVSREANAYATAAVDSMGTP
jgi:MFS family permease